MFLRDIASRLRMRINIYEPTILNKSPRRGPEVKKRVNL